MTDIYLLAIALSMDTFAVSIGLGAKHKIAEARQALIAAVYFGAVQAGMTMVGYLGGRGLSQWIKSVTSYAPAVSCVLLTCLGIKMIYESNAEGVEADLNTVNHRIIFMIALATSLDAMAAGFSLPLLKIEPVMASAIIGFTTFSFSYAGVLIGEKHGARLEGKTGLFGGLLLILLGLKALTI